MKSEEDVPVHFDSEHRLPTVNDVPNLRGENLIVTPDFMINKILEPYVAEMYEPVHNQTDALTAAGLLKGKARLEMYCVGGGSKSDYVRKDLGKTSKGVTVMKYTNHDNPVVAYGALLTAIDPDLGNQEFARTAYGTCYARDDVQEARSQFGGKKSNLKAIQHKPAAGLSDTNDVQQPEDWVFWSWRVGDKITNHEVVDGYIEIVEDYIPTGDDDTIELMMQMAKTDKRVLSSKECVHISEPGVVMVQPLKMEIEKTKHNFPIKNGVMRIETRAVPQFRGMRVYFHFVVHKTGVFPAGDAPHDYLTSDDYIWKELEVHEALAYGELKVADLNLGN